MLENLINENENQKKKSKSKQRGSRGQKYYKTKI